MSSMAFNNLAEYLKQGREIEFSHNGRQYSITNHSGFWYLCDDTDHICLETICRHEEKELLVSKCADFRIEGLSLQQIFDGRFYDAETLYIL